MSTLGGSRGERNAKPKFSALDINSLYRTSRGESLEPLAQKNAVPRKHGMQILGKVPSTRRPPANLPSLKAETSTPTQDQSGSWPAASSPSANVNNQSPASNLEKPSGDQKQHHQHQHQQQQQQQQQHQQQQQQQQQQQHHQQQQKQQQNYQSKSANNSNTGGGGHGNSNNSNSNHNNNSSSASWSAVTSAHEPAVQKPLLYQSPQFQHEFPSLDGSNAQVQSKGNRGTSNANQSDAHHNSHINNNQNANANAADTQYEQNRTDKDGHSEQIASQQSGGNGNSSTAGQVHQRVVPPQFRALMPQFMQRISGFDNLPPDHDQQHQHQQQHYQQQHQHQHHQQQQSQMGGNRDNRRNYGRDQQYQSYNRNARGDRNDDRGYRRGQQPHRSNRHDETQYDDYDTGYQSIIKEEELERIDKIVKEDGWVQDDEIDYNQKLVFSDDDSDTPPPTTRSKDAKRVNFNDRDKEPKGSSQRKDEHESQAACIRESEREKLDREHNERNEREKSENRMQQNGHRSGAPVVDAELLERIKQRKEEEEKRANERRMAAAKKLQELEQKINKKKELSVENENDSNASSSAPAYGKVDANEPRTNERYRSDDGGKIRDNKDARDYGNRYESKFERDIGDRSRDRGAPNTGDAFFNKPYQSNLPPRFQKQRDQQERHTYNKVETPHRPGPREPQIRRSNQPMQQPHIMKRNVDDIRDPKSGYATGNGSGAYSTHSKTSSSGLCESEDDDRVSSGRESISRSSIGERTSHLGRSTSDSSQPEIKDKIGSWADEMEMDFKQPQRQISSTSSTSANDDIQPKQILQRVRKVSIDSRSDKEKSEERELSVGNISIKSLNQSQEDVTRDISKTFGTSPSMIEAPKSWGDSAPTTPEISRKSIENLSDSAGVTAKTETDKKPLESVLENEPSVCTEKKPDEKSNVSTVKTGRGYNKDDRYSSDDGKHGNILKRPNARGGRHDTRGGPARSYGGTTSYRGGNSNWNNNRRRRTNMYNEFDSLSEGSDDEYHGRGNRGKDDRFKHDSSNRRDAPQSHQKDVFVPRGEPSRRGRGGGRTTGPIVKRIDNYGPPNAKSPFGASDDKSESKPDTTTEETLNKKSEPQSADEIAAHTTDSTDAKIPKVDDKKVPSTKPAFGVSAPAPQRKDSTGQKVDAQSLVKPDDVPKPAPIPSQAPQPQRTEKTPPFTADKQHLSGGSQATVGSKPDKPVIVKKEDTSYAPSQRSNVQPINRSKPQINAQSTNKPVSQSLPAKPVGSIPKLSSNAPQSQQPINVSGAVGSGSVVNRPQQPNKMAPRFVKQPRDRTGSSSSNNWEKGDITSIGNTNESDFTQRSSSSIQSIEKLSQDSSNKPDSNAKMSTIIFENTNFKSMPGPIKRQTVPSNQQQMQNTSQQSQRSGVSQYDQVQANNLGGHHSHHSQNQHHLDKKPDDVFKNASSGNFQDMLDSQQQMQSQVQRTHQSQTDVISSALQTMSFPKSDAEYEKDLKLAFTFESEMLNDAQSSEKNSKGGLCIPPSRSTAIHSVASGQNTISPSIADLSKKITSVKKVWETVPSMPTVIEHGNNSSNSGNNDDSHLSSTFVSTQNQQHMHQFTHSQQQQLHQSGLASYSNSFGPDPSSLDHFTKSGGQDADIDNVGYNPSPQHMVGGNTNSHQNAGLKHNDPLSGNANVCKVKQNQQPMHQSSLGLSPPPMQQGIQTAPQPYYQPSQFGGMSAIPSPPAVLYNSTPMPSQYGHYERYIASAHYGGGNAAQYNAPYMQSGPNLQPTPAPDMYQNMTSQFRMSGAINQPPYNQQQQLNNQSTVLISSTSNSLMSASVKPTSQIGAIGTKVNAGQTPYAQQYMGMYAPPQQPPPQNNNYNNYNNSYFGAPNANYGIQATGIFGPQAQPPSNASMNQQPVANYGNFLAINRQYQSQQNNAYSQQQASSRSQQQQQQNPNQSQSQPPSGQQSQQQSNSNSQNQSGPPQSHSQDTVSNSFFK